MSPASVSIPVIDISSNDSANAKALLEAASTYGFVFVENNQAGIPPAEIAQMFELSRTFFQGPLEAKEECSINSNKSGKNRGWLSLQTETLDPGNQKRGDFKEAFNIGEFVDGRAQQPLPAVLAEQEAKIGRFVENCHSLCNRILQLFALALEIDSDVGGTNWFTLRHDRSAGPSGSVLRMLYNSDASKYPSLAGTDYNPELDIRAGAHSDYGSVTLLFQLPGQPGLEILTPGNQWAPVPVDPQGSKTSEQHADSLPILVNIGDLLSYWTHGLLKSTVHRVIYPEESRKAGHDRYSIAYFCHPLDEASLVPIPSRIVDTHAAHHPDGETVQGDLTARDHLNNRLAATYGLKPGA